MTPQPAAEQDTVPTQAGMQELVGQGPADPTELSRRLVQGPRANTALESQEMV